MGWWILATATGGFWFFAFTGLMQLILGPAFTADVWGIATFSAIGGLIGLSQWLFLRRRIPRAGWWIFASALGWGLAFLGSLTAVRNGSALAQLLTLSLSPAIVTAVAWGYLLKPEPPANTNFE
jgi:drug/metabolite transporter (DMT)-like permease